MLLEKLAILISDVNIIDFHAVQMRISVISNYSAVVCGEHVHLKPLKSLAMGFLAMTAAISLYSIITLICSGDVWLGLLYLMILMPPLSFGVYQWRSQKTHALKLSLSEKTSNILFALQGAALACWAYDLATTFYAINVARVATEINPLGWPLGALGALSYYAPTVILTYVLLFRLRAKISLYAAVPITAVALLMSCMNLNAGVGNFTFFVWTASLSTPTRYYLTAFITTVDLAFVAIFASASRKRMLETRKPTMINNV